MEDFVASSWGREFVAGGFGGIALRIMQQSSKKGSALSILRNVVATEGPTALYRGIAAPLASITFQSAMVFQTYAILSRALDPSVSTEDPPSYKGVAIGGFGAGTVQSLMITPVELVKIRLQLQTETQKGPVDVAKRIMKAEGLKGMYRGLTITMLRDAPAHAIYFSTYEYMKEMLHPGSRKTGEESLHATLVAGGLAGVTSWIGSYPLDVVKTRLQAQSMYPQPKYSGIVNCLRKSVREDGHGVLWRGLGTAVSRAFLVNGAIFAAYELALKCITSRGSVVLADNAVL